MNYITVQTEDSKKVYRLTSDYALEVTERSHPTSKRLSPNWTYARLVLRPDAKERLIKQALEYEARR